MAESGYYPAGTEYNPNAPWNQKDSEPVEVSVCVSVTLSKTVKVKVDDYVAEDNEASGSDIPFNFSDCNLREAVCQQIALPNEKFPDWTVDDFEVMLE